MTKLNAFIASIIASNPTIASAIVTLVESFPLDEDFSIDFPARFWKEVSKYEARKGERLYPHGFRGHLDPTEVWVFRDGSSIWVSGRRQVCGRTEIEELDKEFLNNTYFDEFLNEELSYKEAIASILR